MQLINPNLINTVKYHLSTFSRNMPLGDARKTEARKVYVAIDDNTLVPEKLFNRLVEAGKKARNKGQHVYSDKKKCLERADSPKTSPPVSR